MCPFSGYIVVSTCRKNRCNKNGGGEGAFASCLSGRAEINTGGGGGGSG